MANPLSRYPRILFASACVLSLAACNDPKEPTKEPGIHTVLTGQITADASADSVARNDGFAVLVFRPNQRGIDTLGFAGTDETGAFRMDITAPERGMYQLAIMQGDSVLRQADMVVADGDTATLRVRFPLGGRLLAIRSRENSALAAYLNAKVQYNLATGKLVQAGKANSPEYVRSVAQTASTLWSIKDAYAKTVASDLALAESVVMLEGVNDNLLLERAPTISPDNPSYLEVVRAARRAENRLRGFTASLNLLDQYEARALTDEQRAGIEAERVVAYMQARQQENAAHYARMLSETYPETTWATWADRIIYDSEHLMPGMKAPSFILPTWDGGTVSLDSLRGKYVLLEFFSPEQRTFQQELLLRNAFYRAGEEEGLEFVSISVQPNPRINDSFFKTVDFPGVRVVASGGPMSDVVSWYNVRALPKRILIDRQGNIVSNYEGPYLRNIVQEFSALLDREHRNG